MEYLYEVHYHTPETSYCGKTTPMEAFPCYAANGYTGVAVTDHYYSDWFKNLPGMSWRNKIEYWLAGYRSALEAAPVFKLNVILGMELRFTDCLNDYLVYGIDEQILLDYPELYNMKPVEFRELADRLGLFFSQAHPFREVCTPLNPALLHGVEIFNGNPRHQSHNDQARNFAEKNGLIMLSGSDFHHRVDACTGGMYFDQNPVDSRELAELLFNGHCTALKISGDTAQCN